jgi:hypothetical protein
VGVCVECAECKEEGKPHDRNPKKYRLCQLTELRQTDSHPKNRNAKKRRERELQHERRED